MGTPGTLLTKRAHVVSISVLVISSVGRRRGGPTGQCPESRRPRGCIERDLNHTAKSSSHGADTDAEEETQQGFLAPADL